MKLNLSVPIVLSLVLSQVTLSAGEAPASTSRAPNATVSQSAVPTNSVWSRIVLIGASASAGFTISEPLGGTNTQQLRLHRYVDAALMVPHEPVSNLASSFFFMQPEMMGPRQIEQALKAQPTLVIGADFLFWFSYSYSGALTDEERRQRFEKGLKLLEPIRCPLLLGDLPDASSAVGTMLSADQVPSAEALAAANRRLQEWAADRPQVVLLPLSNFMHTAMANLPVTIHGKTLPAGKTRALLQDDKLHPGPQGCATIALAIMEALQSAKPELFAGEIRWDPSEVLRLGSRQLPVSNRDTPAVPSSK